MAEAIELIRPAWRAPDRVRAFTTTRVGGTSDGPWASLNLADHVGDDPVAVRRNRDLLAARLRLPGEPHWLRQVHGVQVRRPGASRGCADACFEDRPGQVCGVLTADCLPVLLCDRAGTQVAAAHAGWRGLLAGILEQTAAAFDGPRQEILAWLGPAIGPRAFEVGDEVRVAFLSADPAAAPCFVAHRPGHWLADLYGLARLRLHALGVERIHGGDHCTFGEASRFFSYRRDGIAGRMASLIWLQP
jgi:YfiH family protein